MHISSYNVHIYKDVSYVHTLSTFLQYVYDEEKFRYFIPCYDISLRREHTYTAQNTFFVNIKNQQQQKKKKKFEPHTY